MDAFHDVQVEFLAPEFSDYCAGFLKGQCRQNARSSFKFFNFLIKNKDFLKVVEGSWASTSGLSVAMYRLSKKLKALKSVLRTLSKENYQNIRQKMLLGVSSLGCKN